MSDTIDPNHPAFHAVDLEDMEMEVAQDAAGDYLGILVNPNSLPSMNKTKKKALNFVKEPNLAEPILQIVETKGYGNTLAHGKKAGFLKYIQNNLFKPGNTLYGYDATNNFQGKWKSFTDKAQMEFC